MIGYLDSSVLLRALLNQPSQAAEFRSLSRPLSSKVLKTECLRTLDRARLSGNLNEEEHLAALSDFYLAMESVELIEVSDSILERASGSFPVALGTLDAIHVASALAWRDAWGEELTLFTHDVALGRGARAMGFTVLGC